MAALHDLDDDERAVVYSRTALGRLDALRFALERLRAAVRDAFRRSA